jgi:hypothetical protein
MAHAVSGPRPYFHPERGLGGGWPASSERSLVAETDVDQELGIGRKRAFADGVGV